MLVHAAPARSVHRRGTGHQPDLVGLCPAGAAILPKQGSKKPWRLSQNYVLDLAAARFGTIDDGTMVFGRPGLERPSA